MKTPFNIRWWNNQAESEYLGLKLKETRILGVNVLEVLLSKKVTRPSTITKSVHGSEIEMGLRVINEACFYPPFRGEKRTLVHFKEM
jgi:hypothetical protein